jgi:hypothetical protein
MRRGGVVDSLVSAALEAARGAGAETEKVYLLEEKIEFCLNCRACAQQPGGGRGACVLDDGMAALLDRCEAAQGLVIGAPVNYFNLNALTRRFMERLICYGYWPWGRLAPEMRSAARPRRAVLITASAMPAVMGRIFTGAVRALKHIAAGLGARPTEVIFAGMAARSEKAAASSGQLARAAAAGRRLAQRGLK